MSLAVAALRLCALKSLDGATSAGLRVFDSVVDPRSLIGEEALPTIVIYTDTGRRKVIGRDLLTSDCHVDLVIELFVAKATKIERRAAGDDEDDLIVEYPATDAGFENRLRRLAYEIESIFTGDVGPWPDMWRRAIPTFSPDHDSEWDRGADAHSGARFNYLRLIYRVVPQGDPVRGAPLDDSSFWAAFLALAEGDDELRLLAKDWRALIETSTLPEWRKRAAELGLTAAELASIGLASPDQTLDARDDLTQLDALTVDPIGTQIAVGDSDAADG